MRHSRRKDSDYLTMNAGQMEKCRRLCAAFRKALEESPYAPGMPFPEAACGETCRLLAQWLSDHGYDFDYVTLERLSDRYSHAWLQRGSIVIDITSDQFDRSFPKVFVGKDSDHPMYAELSITFRRSSNEQYRPRAYEAIKFSAQDWLRSGEVAER